MPCTYELGGRWLGLIRMDNEDRPTHNDCVRTCRVINGGEGALCLATWHLPL